MERGGLTPLLLIRGGRGWGQRVSRPAVVGMEHGVLERARSEMVTDRREKTAKDEKKSRGRSEWKEAV